MFRVRRQLGLILGLRQQTSHDQAVSQRLFWNLPDYPSNTPTPLPVLTIPSSTFQYLDAYSQYAIRRVQLLSLTEYLVLGAALLLWLRRLPRRTEAA